MEKTAARFDVLSIAGIVLALVAMLGGAVLKGTALAALWNSAAFLIVVVGTFASVMVQVNLKVFLHGLSIARWVVSAPEANQQKTLEQIVGWSNFARREGLLGLETAAEEEPDEFSRKALQLLVDGAEPEAIRNIMEVELDSRETFDKEGARVWESLGVYAPTLGIIGAVMGLIAVMQNLADPSKLGSGIATAFVATIYGIGSANLFFLPIGNKLKSIVQARTTHREMILEGLVSIAKGENPRNIENKLRGYLN